jgi:hypothetical protein
MILVRYLPKNVFRDCCSRFYLQNCTLWWLVLNLFWNHCWRICLNDIFRYCREILVEDCFRIMNLKNCCWWKCREGGQGWNKIGRWARPMTEKLQAKACPTWQWMHRGQNRDFCILKCWFAYTVLTKVIEI